VQSLSNEELRLLRERDGKCLCPMRKGELGCTAGPFSDPELSQAVSATAFEGYIAGRMKVLEVHLREEIELSNKEILEKELEKLRSMDGKQREVRTCSFIMLLRPFFTFSQYVLSLCPLIVRTCRSAS